MKQDIASTINFLKWQLLARLPKGSIFERIKGSILHSDISIFNPFYYIYWLDIERPLFEKYLLGTFGTTNEDYKDFIEYLDVFYKNGDFYEIETSYGRIVLPRPTLEHYKCFKAEFLDIIMPSLTTKNSRLASNIPYLEGPYENGNVQLSKGDIVLDLGANYGLFSSLASSKGCQVYAFEPTEEIIKQFLSRLTEIDENINIINKAVSNFTGESLFRTNPTKSSCNKLESGDISSDNSIVRVKTTTIDDFVEESNLSSVDFIKADIEGAERLMLEGARQTLKEYAPKLAICFYHCLDDLEVLTRLIKEANSNYEIAVKYKKIYAHVPNR